MSPIAAPFLSLEKVDPGIRVANDPEQASKPWMYVMYRRTPTVLSKLIEMNGKGQPVLVSGLGMHATPITSMNF